jgi:hypothetical protein
MALVHLVALGIPHHRPYAASLAAATLDDDPVASWLCGFDVAKPAVLDAVGAGPHVARVVEDDAVLCSFPRARTASRRFAHFKTHKTASSSLEVQLASIAESYHLRFMGCEYDVGSHQDSQIGCVGRFESSGPPRFDFELRHLFDTKHWINASGTGWWNDDPPVELQWDGLQWTPVDVPDRPWGCDTGDGLWFDNAVASYRLAIGDDVPFIMPIRHPKGHMESYMKCDSPSRTRDGSAVASARPEVRGSSRVRQLLPRHG